MAAPAPARCVLHESPGALLLEARAHLLARESENSKLLGLLGEVVAGTRRCERPIAASLSRGDEHLGAGLRTAPSSPLLLTRMPDAAVDCLVETLHGAEVALTGVDGVRDASVRFADGWARRRGLQVTTGMRTCLYEVRTVQTPDLEGGVLRQAVPSDEDVAVAFCRGFVCDIYPAEEDPDGRARDTIGRLLPAGHVYLWRNRAGHTVSMAARVRASPNGASISLVYTPPEHRGEGHASRVGACLSQRLLDEGRTLCNLYADLTNPTSNAIYQRLGYRKVAESRRHHFADP